MTRSGVGALFVVAANDAKMTGPVCDQIAGAVAQANFAEISARTVGKEKFDSIRGVLGGITAKFETARWYWPRLV